MAIFLPASFIGRHSKIYPNLDFWFEKYHLATLLVNTNCAIDLEMYVQAILTLRYNCPNSTRDWTKSSFRVTENGAS
jgi:hypothetical protein